MSNNEYKDTEKLREQAKAEKKGRNAEERQTSSSHILSLNQNLTLKKPITRNSSSKFSRHHNSRINYNKDTHIKVLKSTQNTAHKTQKDKRRNQTKQTDE